MAIVKVPVDVCICDQCGADWFKRTKKPVQCPRCHSTNWNIKAETERQAKKEGTRN